MERNHDSPCLRQNAPECNRHPAQKISAKNVYCKLQIVISIKVCFHSFHLYIYETCTVEKKKTTPPKQVRLRHKKVAIEKYQAGWDSSENGSVKDCWVMVIEFCPILVDLSTLKHECVVFRDTTAFSTKFFPYSPLLPHQ